MSAYNIVMRTSVNLCILLGAAIFAGSCSSGKSGASGDLLVADLTEKAFQVGTEPGIPGGFSIGFPRTAVPLSAYTLPDGHRDGLLYDLKWKKPVPGAARTAASSEPVTFTAFRARKEIWVDWNADKRFAPEEKQVEIGVNDGKTYYKPTSAPTGPDYSGVFFGYAGPEDHKKGSTEK